MGLSQNDFLPFLRQPHLARPPTPSRGYKGQALEKKKHDYHSHSWNGKHDRIA